MSRCSVSSEPIYKFELLFPLLKSVQPAAFIEILPEVCERIHVQT
jgi:hypothetical protein